jgi:hypothetical protein
MVAVINFASSLRNVINYNEHKLAQDSQLKDANGKALKKAEFIHSSGYAKDTNKLTFTDRFNRLEKLMALHENRKQSVAHISLNFDPSEKEKLNDDLLKQIADTYMEKIGFGKQPYLVYKHNDAGHPHIHIVSTIVRAKGKPIETHWIGRNFSEPARKEIEQSFGLVEADKKKQKEQFQLSPVNATKATYGRSETKRAITNVLDAVVPSYKYTSLAELNAVLKQYNIVADQGGENSRVFKNNGLVYRILDEQGNKVGVPVKASDIYFKPGIKYLQKKFEKNEPLRGPYKQRIRNAIDLALSKHTIGTIEQLQAALKRENIQLVLRQNKDASVGGLTVVDHLKKVVFKGSTLGPKYSAAGIQQRLWVLPKKQEQSQTVQQPFKAEPGQTPKQLPQPKVRQPKSQLPVPFQEKEHQQKQFTKPTVLPATGRNPLLELIEHKQVSESLPPELTTTKKKKRKKKRLHL